jgi:hypothetical protein
MIPPGVPGSLLPSADCGTTGFAPGGCALGPSGHRRLEDSSEAIATADQAQHGDQTQAPRSPAGKNGGATLRAFLNTLRAGRVTPYSGLRVVVAPIVAGSVLIRVVMPGRSALTGRRGGHSTAGLPVVSAAVLPLADLDPVVGDRHTDLRGQRCVVDFPVGLQGFETGFGIWL